MIKQKDGSLPVRRDVPLLCDGLVRHVGDGIAFIVAETPNQARDAAERTPSARVDQPQEETAK